MAWQAWRDNMVYKFNELATLNKGLKAVDPQVVGEQIERLRMKRGGSFDAADLVNEARSKYSPLHDIFEWDDTEAAELYRRQQARHLLSCVVMVSEVQTEEKESVRRVFVSATDDGTRAYTTVSHILSNAELRAKFLKKLHKELEVLQKRCEMYEDIAAMFTPLAESIQKEVSTAEQKILEQDVDVPA
jgi:Mg2+ and Co2+ transporter CorA